jgi:lipoprotein-releasing system permease protein
MARSTRPFARFEWMIAWRYMRAKRAEGGVSVMTWISLLGVTLAVFGLIAVLAVRSGFRADFVDTIVGANAHVTVYTAGSVNQAGLVDRTIPDYVAMADRIAAVPGVTSAAPIVRAQVMVSSPGGRSFVEVFGISAPDLGAIPRVAAPEEAEGDIARFEEGIAIGSGVARELGVTVGDRIRLTSPDGARTAMGTSPRVGAYEVVYIFTAGRWDIDRTRLYMPLPEAQLFFNRDGVADEIEVMTADPDTVDTLVPAITAAAGPATFGWTWAQRQSSFLQALTVEDNVMFIIMAILVLIASMNIVSGLIMLVKNKGRDIGILRTMGLSEGSILRIFFICGAGIGTLGTVLGVVLGCLFAIYIDQIFSIVNYIAGGGVWDPSIRGLYRVPSKLELDDVLWSVAISLSLSWIVTIFPARRAARMNPVEALRYE